MSPRKRVILLISIMALIVLVVESITISILYLTAVNQQKQNLRHIVTSQARMIEVISRFDFNHNQDYSGGPVEATLCKIMDAHFQYSTFGYSGEFTVAERKGDKIVYILNHHLDEIYNVKSVPFFSESATPSRLALSGKSGTLVSLDSHGIPVLAAYEPVKGLNWGIVAKLDLSEIRAPFIKAAAVSAFLGILVIIAGTIIFVNLTNPLIDELNKTVVDLEDALANVNRLSGLLPICASCKNIRDDKGYWTQIEAYIKDHSEAEFSHSICPDCVKILYGDLKPKEIAKAPARKKDGPPRIFPLPEK